MENVLAALRTCCSLTLPVARQALRKLLPEPLRITPTTVDGRRTLRFEGVTTLGPLFEASIKVWRPHGDSNPGYRRESANPAGTHTRVMRLPSSV